MIRRELHQNITSRLKQFPAVALLGPRQAGKTTLARSFSECYYDLEVEQEKLRLDLQWDEIIQSKEIIILDEAQNYPEIFPLIRNAIDEKRNINGRFMILGSISPGLMKQVSEFLTGRIAICELSPFSLNEISQKGLDNLWFMGGFPDGGILKKGQYPIWQENYLNLLAMRDFPQWGLPATPQVTRRFFRMIAAVHGRPWNASQIGKSLSLSYHTVNSYLDFLGGVYLIRRLEAYSTNIKKRLVKSPKVYWRDSGLLHSLLGVNNYDHLINQPWVGFSWEGFVVEQILNCLDLHDLSHEAFYFRTMDGYELDLVILISGKIWAFEIKLSSATGTNDLDRLKKTSALIEADKMVLISRTKKEIEGKNIVSTNLIGIIKYLNSIEEYE